MNCALRQVRLVFTIRVVSMLDLDETVFVSSIALLKNDCILVMSVNGPMALVRLFVFVVMSMRLLVLVLVVPCVR